MRHRPSSSNQHFYVVESHTFPEAEWTSAQALNFESATSPVWISRRSNWHGSSVTFLQMHDAKCRFTQHSCAARHADDAAGGDALHSRSRSLESPEGLLRDVSPFTSWPRRRPPKQPSTSRRSRAVAPYPRCWSRRSSCRLSASDPQLPDAWVPACAGMTSSECWLASA